MSNVSTTNIKELWRVRVDKNLIPEADLQTVTALCDELELLRGLVREVNLYIEVHDHPDDWGVPCVYTKDLRALIGSAPSDIEADRG